MTMTYSVPHDAPLRSHRRIVLKVSGEFLRQDNKDVLCWNTVASLAESIGRQSSHQWVIVVGGGNIWRGRQGCASALTVGSADTMGMLATHINALALHDMLHQYGVASCIMTARYVEGVGQPFSCAEVDRALNNHTVVICSGGLGVSGMTTDTTALVRAYESGCSLVMKGTKVAGLYTADPMKNDTAEFIKTMTYKDALYHSIGIMDHSALSLGQMHGIKTVLFSLDCDIGGVLDEQVAFSVLHP